MADLTQDVFLVVLVFKREHVCELVLFLHQVEPVWNDGVVLKPILSDGKHDLDHVLHTLVDFRLMQDVPQTLKDGYKKREDVIKVLLQYQSQNSRNDS